MTETPGVVVVLCQCGDGGGGLEPLDKHIVIIEWCILMFQWIISLLPKRKVVLSYFTKRLNFCNKV